MFATRLAGPVVRFLAWGVDVLCLGALSKLISIVCGLLGLLSADAAGGLTVLLTFVLSMAYAIVLEWFWRGQTLGKRLLRLRVVDVEGMRLQPSQVVVRALCQPKPLDSGRGPFPILRAIHGYFDQRQVRIL